MHEQRVVELETKLAFQEKALEDLSLALFNQDKRIEKLESVCEILRQKLADLGESGGVDAGEHDQQPPHY